MWSLVLFGLLRRGVVYLKSEGASSFQLMTGNIPLIQAHNSITFLISAFISERVGIRVNILQSPIKM